MAFLLMIALSSCEKYEDYINDFDYTTVYFAYQNPVRTVFSNNLKIKIGVVMGGRRENKSNETVSYRIAPELLTDVAVMGANTFTLLPADYYTLANAGELTIPKGEMLGEAELVLNRDKFLADPLATTKTYALPLLITGTSLDSILTGSVDKGIARKDYTIIVIKYISQYSGIYYHRGQRSKYDSGGSLIDVVRYVTEDQEDEYIQNLVWNMTTIDATTLKADGIGENYSSDTKKYAFNMMIANDQTVSLSGNATSLIPNITDLGNSRYDKEKKSFYLNYQYIDTNNMKYVMKDTLIFRNDGLKLELW